MTVSAAIKVILWMLSASLAGGLVQAWPQEALQTGARPEEVVFPAAGRSLHGFLWKPEGSGPFPAILWNHGSEKLPGAQPVLAGNDVLAFLDAQMKSAH